MVKSKKVSSGALKMKVSVIVPIYKGNRYIDGLIHMMCMNHQTIADRQEEIEIELVLVNDYPTISLESEELKKEHDFEIVIHNNVQNVGIHQSRINGILVSTGDYILMLDQDDLISDDCICSQMKHIGENDAVIGNGYKMFGDNQKEIYKNLKKQKLATKEWVYVYAANQIVSPGHCLIKKSSIPSEWMQYVITENGGDDLFLWLLMFAHKCKMTTNSEHIYTHVDTGSNLSLNLDLMYKSSDNIISMADKCKVFSQKSLKTYTRRIRFLKRTQGGNWLIKGVACFFNLDICICKLYAYYR